MTYDLAATFRKALLERGIQPPLQIIADGRLHQCDAIGAPGGKDAVYLLRLGEVPLGGYSNRKDDRGWQHWWADQTYTIPVQLVSFQGNSNYPVRAFIVESKTASLGLSRSQIRKLVGGGWIAMDYWGGPCFEVGWLGEAHAPRVVLYGRVRP